LKILFTFITKQANYEALNCSEPFLSVSIPLTNTRLFDCGRDTGCLKFDFFSKTFYWLHLYIPLASFY
jgi:hypothetical protein